MKLNGKSVLTIRGVLARHGFCLLSLLGSGRFGTCYLIARHDEEFVFKLFNANDVKRRKAKLAHEGKWLKRVDHPAVPRLIDIIDQDGIFGLIMEKKPGYSMADLLSWDYDFSRNEILTMMTQLIQVIDYLDTVNITHRDIKTSNILWDKEQLSLIDFGSARNKTPFRQVFNPDFWGIGDVFMRLALSSAELVADPDNLSIDGLKLSETEKNVIKRLLLIAPPYENINLLYQDFVINFS